MTIFQIPGLLALLLVPHETVVPSMTDKGSDNSPARTLPALTLDVQQTGSSIEVRLIGNAVHTQEVSYLIEVTGQSSSRHSGKTTLTGGATSVLSTMRTNVGAEWCVKLVAEEAGREPYEIIEGTCGKPTS